MGGLDLDEKCEISALLYESQICLAAVSAGIKTIENLVESGVGPGERLAERLGALRKMLGQSEEALDALDGHLERLLDRKGGGGVVS